MQTDLYGNKCFKINLHTHTTLSDGKATPEEALERYRAAGYDAVALTDHWHVGEEYEENGVLVLSGVEYNVGGGDARDPVFHIVGLGMERDPGLVKGKATVQEIIDAIRRENGLAVLAHPAWSLNTPEHIRGLSGIEATEIYNSVSGVHNSRRPDSSLIVDMLGCEGIFYPLLAADDAHYYDSDACVAWIVAEAPVCTREAILTAIREQKFYATQGPEIHIARDGDGVTVTSSPVDEVIFYSNATGAKQQRAFLGDGITTAHYPVRDFENFVRAEIIDRNGKHAWSNIIPLH